METLEAENQEAVKFTHVAELTLRQAFPTGLALVGDNRHE